MTARRVIIDTDPGLDDAVAILLAFASPELEVLGLTAVAGNVALELTAANARRLCELAGRADAKVFAGCGRPLLRPQITAVVHGETGLGGANLPPPAMPPQQQHADPEPIKLGQIRPDPVPAADSLTEADLPTFLRRSFPTR